MEALFAIEEALVGLAPEDRTSAAAPVLIDLVFDALSIDEDELNAVTRRGLLLAAAEGNPKESSAAGSRAALETASGLMEDGYAEPLAGAHDCGGLSTPRAAAKGATVQVGRAQVTCCTAVLQNFAAKSVKCVRSVRRTCTTRRTTSQRARPRAPEARLASACRRPAS